MPSISRIPEYICEEISPGVQLLSGKDWKAIRSVFRISISSPSLSECDGSKQLLSIHAGASFANPEVLAVITASPHSPIRYRSGSVQDVSGYYRKDSETYSEPDNLHDALGIDVSGDPVILHPEEQSVWGGGFCRRLLCHPILWCTSESNSCQRCHKRRWLV